MIYNLILPKSYNLHTFRNDSSFLPSIAMAILISITAVLKMNSTFPHLDYMFCYNIINKALDLVSAHSLLYWDDSWVKKNKSGV